MDSQELDQDEGQSSARLRSLIRRAAPILGSGTNGDYASSPGNHGQLPKLIEVYNLLRLQLNNHKDSQGYDAGSTQPARAMYYRLPRRNNERVDGSDKEAILDKLSSFNFRRSQTEMLSSYCEVRHWFFRSQQYLHWCKGRSWQLCCYGEPRCGKVSHFTAHF